MYENAEPSLTDGSDALLSTHNHNDVSNETRIEQLEKELSKFKLELYLNINDYADKFLEKAVNLEKKIYFYKIYIDRLENEKHQACRELSVAKSLCEVAHDKIISLTELNEKLRDQVKQLEESNTVNNLTLKDLRWKLEQLTSRGANNSNADATSSCFCKKLTHICGGLCEELVCKLVANSLKVDSYYQLDATGCNLNINVASDHSLHDSLSISSSSSSINCSPINKTSIITSDCYDISKTASSSKRIAMITSFDKTKTPRRNGKGGTCKKA